MRETLYRNIEQRTEELVQVKLARAQEQEERDGLDQQLRRGAEKQRALELRVAELEARLDVLTSDGADKEEAQAVAFRELFNQQERELAKLRLQVPGGGAMKAAESSGAGTRGHARSGSGGGGLSGFAAGLFRSATERTSDAGMRRETQ